MGASVLDYGLYFPHSTPEIRNMTPPLSGGCLCGAVRYQISSAVTELRACHCTACQKHSGAGGTVNALVPSADVKFTQGKPKRFTMKADSGRTLHRYFCGDCGSPLYSQREIAPERMVIRAGTFDNPPPMKISAHIWTGSKRNWSHIDADATQIPGQPD
jgi:hypothetical protein